MDHQVKYLLDESEMPRQWYNVIPDLPAPPPPPLHPGTGQPVGPDALAPLGRQHRCAAPPLLASLAGASLGRAGGTQTGGAGGVSSPPDTATAPGAASWRRRAG